MLTQVKYVQVKLRIQAVKKRKDFRGPKPAKEGTFVESGDVMGSPIDVDIDGMNMSNPSAAAYYKDLM